MNIKVCLFLFDLATYNRGLLKFLCMLQLHLPIYKIFYYRMITNLSSTMLAFLSVVVCLYTFRSKYISLFKKNSAINTSKIKTITKENSTKFVNNVNKHSHMILLDEQKKKLNNTIAIQVHTSTACGKSKI